MHVERHVSIADWFGRSPNRSTWSRLFRDTLLCSPGHATERGTSLDVPDTDARTSDALVNHAEGCFVAHELLKAVGGRLVEPHHHIVVIDLLAALGEEHLLTVAHQRAPLVLLRFPRPHVHAERRRKYIYTLRARISSWWGGVALWGTLLHLSATGRSWLDRQGSGIVATPRGPWRVL